MPKNFIGEPYSASIFSGIEKFYASERGEWLSRFSVKTFLSHGAEKFRRGESFSSISLISVIEKIYASESYVTVFDFLSNFFCLADPKSSLGVILQCFINFGYRKTLCFREGGGGIEIFRRNFFVSRCRKIP